MKTLGDFVQHQCRAIENMLVVMGCEEGASDEAINAPKKKAVFSDKARSKQKTLLLFVFHVFCFRSVSLPAAAI